MAKTVDAGPVKATAKRKREILAEVTDHNQTRARTQTSTTSQRDTQANEKSQVANAEGLSKLNIKSRQKIQQPTVTNSRIPPSRANINHVHLPRPVFVPPTKEQRENPAPLPPPREEDYGRVFKKRHTEPKVEQQQPLLESPAIFVTAPQISEEDEIASHLVEARGDDDEDITGMYDEIDLEDLDDPLMCAEYVGDIIAYWKATEVRKLWR